MKIVLKNSASVGRKTAESPKITFLINKTQSLSQHIALKEFEHETKVRELEKEIADLKQKPVRLNEKDEKQ